MKNALKKRIILLFSPGADDARRKTGVKNKSMDNFELIKEKWPDILDTIKTEYSLTNLSFDSWLKPLELYSADHNSVTFVVPMGTMGINVINKKYSYCIKVSIAEVTGLNLMIHLITPEQAQSAKENGEQFRKETRFTEAMRAANLDPKHTFDSFVVGGSNMFASMLALFSEEDRERLNDLPALLRGMGQLSPEERPKMGQMINEAREKLTALLDEKQAELSLKEKEARLALKTIDVTEPRPLPPAGAEHPMNLVLSEVLDCFTSMGFSVVEGPEVELDLYNFELLNVPKNYPARDAQDTF